MAEVGQGGNGEYGQWFEVVLWDARARAMHVVRTVGDADQATMVFYDEVVQLLRKGVNGELLLRHRDATAFPILRQPLLSSDDRDVPLL